MQDRLIIRAEITSQPTESLALRLLTSISKDRLALDNLIEADLEFIDLYYKYLRMKGLYDFISAMVTPEEGESGIRLDTEYNYSLTILTDRITWKNLNPLVGQIHSLCDY